ncbi:MAG TPA: YciI family protein [Bacteroidota bacterium]
MKRDTTKSLFPKSSVQVLWGIVLLFGIASYATSQEKAGQGQSKFDSTLARQLNADEYGMKKYVLAFLKAGPNRSQDSATAANLQRQHLGNIQRMAREGKLVLAGPFLDDTDLKGIYLFNVESVDEARALTGSDPAIKAGRLIMELHPWYGSAALQQVNEIHRQLQRKSF